MNKFISDYIKNNTKTIFLEMTHPQKKAMRLLLRQIMKLGSGLLRELGDTGKGIPKTIGQKFSYYLGKISLNLEQIRVLKFKKFQNLVSLMHLGVLLNEFLSQIVQKNAKKLTKFAITQIYIAYEKFKTF